MDTVNRTDGSNRRIGLYAAALAALLCLNIGLALLLPAGGDESGGAAEADSPATEAVGQEVAEVAPGAIAADKLAESDAMAALGDDARYAVEEALASWLEGRGLDPHTTMVSVPRAIAGVAEPPQPGGRGAAQQNSVPASGVDRVVHLDVEGVDGLVAITHADNGWSVAEVSPADEGEADAEGRTRPAAKAPDAPQGVDLSRLDLPDDAFVPKGLDEDAASSWRAASRTALGDTLARWCLAHDVYQVSRLSYGKARQAELPGPISELTWDCVMETGDGRTFRLTLTQSELGSFGISSSSAS